MKKKKYKLIKNNRHIFAIKKIGNKGYRNKTKTLRKK